MVKVSVVIPVYNVEDYLEECLDGIVNQTLEDIEIICVNDGSSDKSLEILNRYAEKDDRFTVIDQENGGHAVATNRGMKLAKGKYLYLMDSDDMVEINALEDTYKICEEKNLDFVIFQAINYYMDEDKYVKAENYTMNKLADFVGDKVFNYKDIEDLIFTITVTPWSKLYNREFVMNCGAKFPEGLVFDDNVFFWEVLFSAERIGFHREHLFKRRWHSASSTVGGGMSFIDSLAICDLITDTFIRFNQFEKHKKTLYNRKVQLGYMRFSKIKEELKELYFEEMKKNYTEFTQKEYYEDFLDNLTNKNRATFEKVLEANNSTEFLLLRQNYLLKQDNKKLKKQNKKLKKKNKSLLTSNSWKITKPLRKLGQLKK